MSDMCFQADCWSRQVAEGRLHRKRARSLRLGLETTAVEITRDAFLGLRLVQTQSSHELFWRLAGAECHVRQVTHGSLRDHPRLLLLVHARLCRLKGIRTMTSATVQRLQNHLAITNEFSHRSLAARVNDSLPELGSLCAPQVSNPGGVLEKFCSP